MKLYKTGGYKELIEEIEATRVTDKCYWQKSPFNGVENRLSMRSNYDNVWKTKDEAKQYLLEKTTRSLEATKSNLNKLRSKLDQIESIIIK